MVKSQNNPQKTLKNPKSFKYMRAHDRYKWCIKLAVGVFIRVIKKDKDNSNHGQEKSNIRIY